MWKRLKGGRGAAAEETGKVCFFPLHLPGGEGADWVEGWGKEKPCSSLPALATL